MTVPLSLLLYLASPGSVHADFEAGNTGKVEWVSDNHVRCAVNGERDQDGRNRQPSWFYFRIDGVAGRDLTVDLSDLAGEYNYRPHDGSNLRGTRPVYSFDERTWHHFESSEWITGEATVRVRLKVAGDRVWIARQVPYTASRLRALLNELRSSPWLKQETIGKSFGGRPILLLTVTDPKTAESGKQVAWLMARQHAWESGTTWVAEGALRFLLSNDARAARIRERFIFKIFPIADPDGVDRGGVRFNANGYDLNRNWDAVDPKLMPEIDALGKAMRGRMDFFLAMHNDESTDYVEGPPGPLVDRLSKLLDETTHFYAPKGPRRAPVTTTPGMKGRQTVNQALVAQRNAPAYLMELMVNSTPKLGRPPTVKDRLEFGGALVRAIAEALSSSAPAGAPPARGTARPGPAD